MIVKKGRFSQARNAKISVINLTNIRREIIKCCTLCLSVCWSRLGREREREREGEREREREREDIEKERERE